MTKKKMTYREATEELEQIVQSLEQGDLNIDELAEKVKKATTLLQYCKEKLRTIEDEVNDLMDESDE